MNHCKRWVMLIATPVLASAFSMPANAETIKIALEAIVTEVSDNGEFLGGQVNEDDVITGVYTYDSDTPDGQSIDLTTGSFLHQSPQYGMVLQVNGLKFHTDPAHPHLLVKVENKPNTEDSYSVVSANNVFDIALPVTGANNYMDWNLYDPTRQALSDDLLPVTAPVLTDWQAPVPGDLFIGSKDGTNENFLIFATVISAKKLICTGKICH